MQPFGYCSAVLHASTAVPPGLFSLPKDNSVVLYYEDTLVEGKNMERLSTRGHATVKASSIDETVVSSLTAEKSQLKKVYVSGSVEALWSRFSEIHLYPHGAAKLQHCTYDKHSSRMKLTGEHNNLVMLTHCAGVEVVILQHGHVKLDYCSSITACIQGASSIFRSQLAQAELIGPVTLEESGVEVLKVDAKHKLDLRSSTIGVLEVYFSGDEAPTLHLTHCHVNKLVFHSKTPGIAVVSGTGAVKAVHHGRLLTPPLSKL